MGALRHMSRRKFLQTSSLAALGATATACGGGGSEGGAELPGFAGVRPRQNPEQLASQQTLNVFSFSQLDSFDPAKLGPTTLGGNGLSHLYTAPLLRPTPDVTPPYKAVGATAESYQVSADGLTYTFRLRPDAKFNDGQPITAEDFVYSWRRLLDPRVAAPYGSRFAAVVKGGEKAIGLGPDAGAGTIDAALRQVGVRAVDDRTFEVVLSQPAPYFVWIASLPQASPLRRDVIEKNGEQWATNPETLVTNGPFKVTEIGSTATKLAANQHFWNKQGLDQIVAFYGLKPPARWTKYLNGGLDVINGPPKESLDAVLNKPKFYDEIIRYPELSNNWLEFNTSKSPFDDPRVRLAFAKAINRQAYIKVATNKMVQPLTTLIPEGLPGYNPKLGAPQEFDPQRARAMLDKARIKPQDLGTLIILTFSVQERDAVFFKDQLEKNLGVKVNVASLQDSASLEARTERGEYDLVTTFLGHKANYPDPQDFFAGFLSGGAGGESAMSGGGTAWRNQRYDELVRKANRTQDRKQRLQLYDQAQEILVREAPVVFLAQPVRRFFAKPWLRGITRTRMDNAWLPGSIHSEKLAIAQH